MTRTSSGDLIYDFNFDQNLWYFGRSDFESRQSDKNIIRLTRSHEKLQKELLQLKKVNTELRNQLSVNQIPSNIVPHCSTSLPNASDDLYSDNLPSVVSLLPAIARNPAEARKGRKWKSSSTTRRDAKRRAFFIRKQFPSSMLDNTQRFQPF